MQSDEPSIPRFLAAGVLLASLTWLVYGQSRSFDFVNFDDDEYVYANPVVIGGLTLHGIAEAFRFRSGNWHPLTWISHMTDVEAFGLNPGAHHLTNVALHLANVLLLLVVLARLTGAFARSAVVAAIFAVHPLNVENVAWIAERKTLLSMLFLLLALLAWDAWVRRPGGARMGLVVIAFMLGLLSKPYVITLPLLLVALDVWPLRRLSWTFESVRARLVEKLPLFVCAAISAGLTYRAQLVEGAVAGADAIPLGQRFANAIASLAWYFGSVFLPRDLSFYYPHPATLGRQVPVEMVGLGLLLVLAAAIAAVALRSRAPFVGPCFAWFFVSLLPVIGIVQVGLQARADRYAYLPMIGILVVAVWSAELLLGRISNGNACGVFFALIAVALFAREARVQTSNWRNSETLFSRAVAIDGSNWAAWQNLGVVSLEQGDLETALARFERAYTLYDRNGLAAYDVGHVFSLRDQPRAALQWYERALALRPDDVKALVALALTWEQLGDVPRSVSLAKRAAELAPDSPDALYGVALVSRSIGDRESFDRAVGRLRRIAPALAAELER